MLAFSFKINLNFSYCTLTQLCIGDASIFRCRLNLLQFIVFSTERLNVTETNRARRHDDDNDVPLNTAFNSQLKAWVCASSTFDQGDNAVVRIHKHAHERANRVHAHVCLYVNRLFVFLFWYFWFDPTYSVEWAACDLTTVILGPPSRERKAK